MNKHKRLTKLEENKRYSAPVRVFILGCDEPEPTYEGRKFCVHLSHTKAELEVKNDSANRL